MKMLLGALILLAAFAGIGSLPVYKIEDDATPADEYCDKCIALSPILAERLQDFNATAGFVENFMSIHEVVLNAMDDVQWKTPAKEPIAVFFSLIISAFVETKPEELSKISNICYTNPEIESFCDAKPPAANEH